MLVNLDRAAEILRTLAPGVEVRGLADSGWFLDRKPYRPDAKARSPVDAIKVAKKHDKGRCQGYPIRQFNVFFHSRWVLTGGRVVCLIDASISTLRNPGVATLGTRYIPR